MKRVENAVSAHRHPSRCAGPAAIACLLGGWLLAGVTFAGVVVESVDVTAVDLLAGDVLVSWRRSTPIAGRPASGSLVSPFDWIEVENEQLPRGEVALQLRRGDREFEIRLPPTNVRLQSRPELSADELAAWKRGGADLAELADRLAARGATDAALFVRIRAGDASSREEAECLLAGDLGRRAVDRRNRARALSAISRARRRAGDLVGAELALLEAAADWSSFDADGLTLAAAWQSIAALAHSRGQLEDAEFAYRAAIDIRARATPDHVLLASAWNGLGNVARSRGEFELAELAHRLALGLAIAAEPEGLIAANTWNAIGNLRQARGQPEAAEEALRRALEIYRRLDPGGLRVAAALVNLGVVADARRDLARAIELYSEALPILEQRAADSLDLAAVLNNLGAASSGRHDVESAESYHRRALAIRERIAPDSPDVAVSLTNLGVVAEQTGDLDLAESYQRRALAIRQRRAPQSLEVAYTLLNLGNIVSYRGRWAEADALYAQALAIEEQLAPCGLDVARLLASLGGTAAARGDRVRADALHRAALAIKQDFAPISTETASSLTSLSELAEESGDRASARELSEAALELYRRLAPESPVVADAMARRAKLLDLPDQREADLLTALAIHQRAAPDGLGMAAVLAQLAAVALERGAPQRAEAWQRETLAIYRRLAPGSELEAAALHDLGLAHAALGEAASSIADFERAVEVLDRQRGWLGGEADAGETFGARVADYERQLIAALAAQGRAEEAFTALERSRARSFLRLLRQRRLDFGHEAPPELIRERRIASELLRRAEAELASVTPTDPVYRERFGARRRASEREHAATAALQRALPRLAELEATKALDLTAARATLEPGELFLAYSVAPDVTWLFALRREGLTLHRLALDRSALERRVRQLDQMLKSSEAPAERIAGSARALGRDLLGPVLTAIASARSLTLSPDGVLHDFPFAVAGTADGLPVAERISTTYALSLTVLAELRAQPAVADGDVVLFGDPAVTGTAAERLPGTRVEIEAVQSLFGSRARSYFGAEADEAGVGERARDAAILHFASHGVFDPVRPLDSGLLLAPGGDQDGFLQAWEIIDRLHLNASVVTLSACETARGENRGGEGRIGLTRAFQFAGARAVVAAQWPVDDAATAELMALFYREIRSGAAPAEALRRAQSTLASRAPTAHPFYWAGFALYGAGDLAR